MRFRSLQGFGHPWPSWELFTPECSSRGIAPWSHTSNFSLFLHPNLPPFLTIQKQNIQQKTKVLDVFCGTVFGTRVLLVTMDLSHQGKSIPLLSWFVALIGFDSFSTGFLHIQSNPCITWQYASIIQIIFNQWINTKSMLLQIWQTICKWRINFSCTHLKWSACSESTSLRRFSTTFGTAPGSCGWPRSHHALFPCRASIPCKCLM